MRYRVWLPIIGLGLGLLGLGLLLGLRSPQISDSPPPDADPTPSVAAWASQITVRILAESGAGSGVILDRQHDLYTVLTCDHVLDLSDTDRYQVLTSRQESYEGRRLPWQPEADLDLGLVRFESAEDYPVVSIAAPPVVGSLVLAAGFANWQLIDPGTLEDTRDWGIRALRITQGQLALYPERSLPRGYQLGYTNDVEQGMSGGPILDTRGQLVGVNGRLKFPPQGITVFTFQDGSQPSQAEYERMRELSWGIPVLSLP